MTGAAILILFIYAFPQSGPKHFPLPTLWLLQLCFLAASSTHSNISSWPTHPLIDCRRVRPVPLHHSIRTVNAAVRQEPHILPRWRGRCIGNVPL